MFLILTDSTSGNPFEISDFPKELWTEVEDQKQEFGKTILGVKQEREIGFQAVRSWESKRQSTLIIYL